MTLAPGAVAVGAFAVEPPRERPDSPPPSYGVPRQGGEFIEWSHVVDVLAWREMPTSTRWRFQRNG